MLQGRLRELKSIQKAQMKRKADTEMQKEAERNQLESVEEQLQEQYINTTQVFSQEAFNGTQFLLQISGNVDGSGKNNRGKRTTGQCAVTAAGSPRQDREEERKNGLEIEVSHRSRSRARHGCK